MGYSKLEEVWNDILGYEGLYKISNFGRVKSTVRNERILKARAHSGGYLRVNLCKDGKSKDAYIHRLVAQAFLDNPYEKCDVNHKDGNKENNCVENLEWTTRSENQKHAFDTGLNSSPRAMLGKFGELHNRSKRVSQYDLDGKLLNTYGSIAEASRITGANATSISNCCKGVYAKAMGFIWRFTE